MAGEFSITCSDGTVFDLHSELVRGEPRFYWTQRRRPQDDRSRSDFPGKPPDGSYNKRTAINQLKRSAAAYEDTLADNEEAS